MTPFTELERDREGIASGAPDAAPTATPWSSGWMCAYPFLQVFSGDTLAPERRRRGPRDRADELVLSNAFRSGDRLITLAPQDTASALWGVRLTDSDAA